MHKTVILALATLILMAPAASLQAELFPVDRVANEHKAGQYILQVTNDEEEPVSVRVKTQSQCSDCLYVPDSYIQLQPNTSENTTVNLYGDQDIPAGRYGFQIFVSEIGTSRNIKISDYYLIERSYSLIFSSFNKDKEVYMPGDKVKTSVQVKNIGGQTIDDYSINSTLFNQTKNVEGLEIINRAERSYDFSFQVPKDMKPGTEILETDIYRNGNLESSISRSIEVGSSERVEVTEETVNRVVTMTRTLKVNNTGNVNTSTELTQQVPGYLTPFTNYSPEPDNITSQNDSTVISWNIETSPGQQKTVSYTVNYWVPLLILAGLTSLLVMYKRFNQDVSFEKHVAKSKDGEITINIEIENNSSQAIEGLKVKDFIPNIAEVEKTFEFAKPSIRTKNEGTELTWDLDVLEPGDQRVLEYKIRPRIEVEGEVTLPGAELLKDGEQDKKTKELDTDFHP